jgi:hypothetical protein
MSDWMFPLLLSFSLWGYGIVAIILFLVCAVSAFTQHSRGHYHTAQREARNALLSPAWLFIALGLIIYWAFGGRKFKI